MTLEYKGPTKKHTYVYKDIYSHYDIISIFQLHTKSKDSFKRLFLLFISSIISMNNCAAIRIAKNPQNELQEIEGIHKVCCT